MYEAVHAHPEGESTVARQAMTADEYGFDGIIVRNHGNQQATFDTEAITESTGVDVVHGVEVRAEDPSQASGFVGNHRSKQTIVAVHGGTRSINRFAVENPAVDVLAHPMAGDGDFNHVLANAARENGVRIEFSFRSVLRDSGGSRVRALQSLRKLHTLVDDANAPYVVSADPRSHLQIRTPRELQALGSTVGFDPDQIETGLAEWGRLTERNRRLTNESTIEPGVCLDDTE